MYESFKGHWWILHLLDNFSRLHHLYLLKHNMASLRTSKNFTSHIKNHQDTTPKIIRLDSEILLSNAFDEWVASYGITVEQPAPYTLQQNGAAEQAGRTLVIRASMMLIAARLA
jgi:hypothetical protein